ncbi:coat protein [Urochloa streak virus]|uniref:Capsid protein n=1 Tax=Urochloa streak virus TaxID=520848 RepID=B3FVY5_9GEMI|nr:coat protein [Urochloa streak virus]ACC68173.1 coat protein [Urochloa streak virus]ACC68176.1 coat protein [Urochloa streak virus]ACC68179.1 coat protein [Urochloa streak virus]ACC68182.1 coat protein [Urochloa streak virus]ACC68185.1 coat protein [Urochloa streak virus]
MSSSLGKRKRSDEGAWSKGKSKKKAMRGSSSRRPGPVRGPRPALQIAQYIAAGTSMVTVPSGGVCELLATYARGSDEGNRHTNETVTYKVALDYHFVLTAEACRYSSIGVGVAWLVYDAQPTGNAPQVSDIFPHGDTLAAFPYTWKVGREVCHRFVVKRRWTFTMESDGRIGSDIPRTTDAWPPCKRSIYFHKFVTGLGVKTEWKNVADGGVGAIKKGALYLVIAPGNGLTFTAHGIARLYFKSVGNQ